MTHSALAPPAASPTRPPASPPASTVPALGVTIYGCDQDEAASFGELAPRLGIVPTITEAAVSDDNIGLAAGHRCISIGHKTPVTHRTLLALSKTGVSYISTRSVGYDHLDVDYARAVGITVEPVAYSPDSVADYTLMLMLMAVRDAKAVVTNADRHDYRLPAVRGRELRDLTIGVIGAGRIGAAVIDRLRGFGARILAHDTRPATSAGYVPLDELLAQSDIVTLHTPLCDTTHHLLDRRRIDRLKRGAVIVNTGRGGLIDSEALVRALESGKLGGAALDVLEGEQGIFYADCSDRAIDSDLLLRLHRLPNALISPHTAYYTDHALRDTVEHSLINCLNFAGRERDG